MFADTCSKNTFLLFAALLWNVRIRWSYCGNASRRVCCKLRIHEMLGFFILARVRFTPCRVCRTLYFDHLMLNNLLSCILVCLKLVFYERDNPFHHTISLVQDSCWTWFIVILIISFCWLSLMWKSWIIFGRFRSEDSYYCLLKVATFSAWILMHGVIWYTCSLSCDFIVLQLFPQRRSHQRKLLRWC